MSDNVNVQNSGNQDYFTMWRTHLDKAPKDFFGVNDLIHSPPVDSDNSPIVGWDKTVLKFSNWSHDFSPEAVVGTVLRLAAGIFVLPAFATIGTAYHSIVGVANIVTALTGQVRQMDVAEVQKNMRAGINHLVLAVYNLAVGLLSVIIALAFAAQPEKVIQYHDWFHNGVFVDRMEDDGQGGQRPVLNNQGLPLKDCVVPSKAHEFAEHIAHSIFPNWAQYDAARAPAAPADQNNLQPQQPVEHPGFFKRMFTNWRHAPAPQPQQQQNP